MDQNYSDSRRFRLFCTVVLTVLAIIALLPILLIVIASVTDEKTLLANGYTFFPSKLSNMDDFKEFIYYVDNSRLHASLLMNKMVDPIVSSGYLSIPGTDNKIDFKTISTINVCIKTPNELLYIWQNTFKRKTIDNTDNN